MPKHSRAKFQDIWLNSDSPFKSWVSRSKLDTEAYCTLCCKSISVASMGESALKKHTQTQKHLSITSAAKKTLPVTQLFRKNEQDANNYNSTSRADTSTAAENFGASTSSTRQNTALNPSIDSSHVVGESKNTVSLMTAYIANDATTEAEILWCINSVMSHFSARAASASINVLARMFKDSPVAQGMKLGKDKIRYMITHGIAPYFRKQLVNEVSAASFFVALFDESMNKISQKGQMDINVRYVRGNGVHTRYLTH